MEPGNVSATSSASGDERRHGGAPRVLLVPLPAQGHTNPMLQLGRRLAYHGLRPTLALTRYVLSTGPGPGDPFRVAAISDGFDAGGMASCPDVAEYLTRMEDAGSETPCRRSARLVNPTNAAFLLCQQF